MSDAFDPSEPAQRRFTAYGPAALPDPRDTAVDTYVTDLIRAGPAAVHEAAATASLKGKQVLLSYCERAATRAARAGSKQLLVAATVAAVVGGLEQYEREALMRMPIIEDASSRVGIHVSELFEEVARIVGHPGSVSLARWLSREPADRTLAAMGFSVADDGSGLRYVWKP